MAGSNGNRNGVRWPVIISAGSLILALLGASGGIIRYELVSIKDAAAADRALIRAQLEQLSSRIAPAGELNYRDQVLQSQINSLNERLDRTEQQLHQLQQRGR